MTWPLLRRFIVFLGRGIRALQAACRDRITPARMRPRLGFVRSSTGTDVPSFTAAAASLRPPASSRAPPATTVSRSEPRRHATMLRHGFLFPASAVLQASAFATAQSHFGESVSIGP